MKIYAKSKEYDNMNLNIISQHLDPMTYVLLYPDGKPGWNRYRINSTNNKRISMLQHKISQLAIQKNIFNVHLHARKLLQQWIVDSYLQIEANNVNFIKQNQKKLRIEQYQGLMDYLITTLIHHFVDQ